MTRKRREKLTSEQKMWRGYQLMKARRERKKTKQERLFPKGPSVKGLIPTFEKAMNEAEQLSPLKIVMLKGKSVRLLNGSAKILEGFDAEGKLRYFETWGRKAK